MSHVWQNVFSGVSDQARPGLWKVYLNHDTSGFIRAKLPIRAAFCLRSRNSMLGVRRLTRSVHTVNNFSSVSNVIKRMYVFVSEDHLLDWHSCQICYPLEIKLLLLLVAMWWFWLDCAGWSGSVQSAIMTFTCSGPLIFYKCYKTLFFGNFFDFSSLMMVGKCWLL